MLVGTKQDLNSDRRISQEEAEKWCKAQTPTLLYVEVSAKTGHNVKELYSSACKVLTSLSCHNALSSLSVLKQFEFNFNTF